MPHSLGVFHATAIAAAALAVSGCAGNKVAGKWNAVTTGPLGLSITTEMEFKPDGTEATRMGNVIITGNYAVKGDTLTITHDLPRALPTGSTLSATTGYRYSLNGDTMKLTGENGAPDMTLTRIKE